MNLNPPPPANYQNSDMGEALHNRIILSIIIPIYNVAPYLPTCLDSVLSQMNSEMEIILIDDGSDDNSPQIIKSYHERYSFIQVITHKHNKSLGAARNSGFKIARGEWIYFLDSDDFIANNTLIPIMDKLKLDEPDMLIFSVSPYDNNSSKVLDRSNFRILPKNGAKYVIYRNFDQRLFSQPFKHFLAIGNYPLTGNKVFRRWIVESYPFPENIYYEDLPFYIHSLVCAKSQARLQCNSSELMMYYRINRPQSITNTNNYNPRKGQDIIIILDECSKIIKERMPKLNAYFLVNRIWTGYFHIRDTSQNRISYARQFIKSIFAHFKLLSFSQKLTFPLLFIYHFIYKLINFSGNFSGIHKLLRKYFKT